MYRFLSVIFFIGATQCNPRVPVIPCKYNDFKCMIISYNTHYHQEFVPNYGIDTFEINSYTMTSPGFSISYEKPVMLGAEDCYYSNLIVDIPARKFNATLTCPQIIITGKYRASGLLLGVLPVDGVGPYYQLLYNCDATFATNLDIYTGPDHEKHINLTTILSNTYEYLGAIIPQYKNLVYGNKMASEAAQDFLDQNSREFLTAYINQIYDPYLLEFLKRLNMYQAKVPLQYLFSEPEYKWYTQVQSP